MDALELKDYMTFKSAKDLLGVKSRQTIYNYVETGKLRQIVIDGHPYVFRSEIEKLKQEREGNEGEC